MGDRGWEFSNPESLFVCAKQIGFRGKPLFYGGLVNLELRRMKTRRTFYLLILRFKSL